MKHQKRLDEIERRLEATSPSRPAYQSFATMAEYEQAAADGEVMAYKVYINFSPDDWDEETNEPQETT